MIRVLHFVSTPAIWSGVMGVIMNYYRHLDRSEIQFDFLCFLPCEESYEEEIRTLGGRVFFLPKPGVSLHALKAVNEFFKEHGKNYDWLHNHEVYLSFFLRPISKHYGIKNFIIHSHATKYSDRIPAAWRNRILCLPIRFISCKHMACSRAAGEFLFHRSLGKKIPCLILPNAIEPQAFYYKEAIRSQYREQLGLESAYLIGHIGRFVPQKNHRFLLSVFRDVLEETLDAHLLLIGDGPLKRDMERYADQLNITEHVHFLGQRKDTAPLLWTMDLFVLPSLYEGLPVSCLEAQAAGLPCIIADTVSREVQATTRMKWLSLESYHAWAAQCLESCRLFSEGQYSDTRVCPEGVPDISVEAGKLAKFYETGACHFEYIF